MYSDIEQALQTNEGLLKICSGSLNLQELSKKLAEPDTQTEYNPAMPMDYSAILE